MKHVVKIRMYIVHAADSTEMVFLENVLGFVRVIQVVLDHIKEKLPEQLGCSSWPLDWPEFDVDTAPSDVEGNLNVFVHGSYQATTRYEVAWVVIDPNLASFFEHVFSVHWHPFWSLGNHVSLTAN